MYNQSNHVQFQFLAGLEKGIHGRGLLETLHSKEMMSAFGPTSLLSVWAFYTKEKKRKEAKTFLHLKECYVHVKKVKDKETIIEVDDTMKVTLSEHKS